MNKTYTENEMIHDEACNILNSSFRHTGMAGGMCEVGGEIVSVTFSEWSDWIGRGSPQFAEGEYERDLRTGRM